jgi:tetratricopeptide (TPR) repeat protein
MWTDFLWFLQEYTEELGSFAVLGAGGTWVLHKVRRPKTEKEPEIVTKQDAPKGIHMDADTFADLQRKLRDEAHAELSKAHGDERQRLEDKIETLNARLRDPEEALAQQLAIITDLEAKLARRGNEIGGDDLAAATTALEAGDFTKARMLFETLAARTAPEVAANADAEFALGQIAEAEIRWHDAYRHYATAARRSSTYDRLRKAREFAWRAGDYPAAFRLGEDLLKTARASGSQIELPAALNEHALTLHAQGRYPEAEGLYRQALEITRATIGEAHITYATYLNNLAGVVQAQGRYPEAEDLFRQALEIDRATIGEAHPAYATRLNNPAHVIHAQGRYPESEDLFRQALKISRATIGEAHPDYATRLNNLANVIQAQGRYPESEDLFRQALKISRATIGEAHPDYAIYLNNLASVVRAQGRYPEAEGLFRQAQEIGRATIGEAHPDYAARLNNLAGVVEAQGRYPEAEGLYAEAIAILRKSLGDAHPNTRTVADNFLDLITNHLPASPHRAGVEALLAQNDGDPPAAKS